ncbi:MAG: hypothetical protein ACRD1N_03725 [Terriglobia bacterium]
MNNFRERVLAMLLIAGAILLALPAGQLRAAPQPALHVHVGEKAPGFTLPSAGGGLVSLSQFAGQNVLVDFYEGYW